MREGRAGGGGAIDLVQYLKDIGFREAVRELGGLAVLARASLRDRLRPRAPPYRRTRGRGRRRRPIEPRARIGT